MQPNHTKQESIRRVLTSGFTVRDLAEPLVSFDSGTPAAEAVQLMTDLEYDVVGVREQGQIVGFVELEKIGNGICGEQATRFEPTDVIDDGSGLADLVTRLTEQPRQFVSLLGGIYGIATRHDLEKAPMRMWLFGMVTIIEQRLVRVIELRHADGNWKRHLSPARVTKAEELLVERKRRGIPGKILDCLQFSDKGQILIRDADTRASMGFESRRAAERILKNIEALRNNLAHSQDIVHCDWETVVMLAGNLERVITGPAASAMSEESSATQPAARQ